MYKFTHAIYRTCTHLASILWAWSCFICSFFLLAISNSCIAPVLFVMFLFVVVVVAAYNLEVLWANETYAMNCREKIAFSFPLKLGAFILWDYHGSRSLFRWTFENSFRSEVKHGKNKSRLKKKLLKRMSYERWAKCMKLHENYETSNENITASYGSHTDNETKKKIGHQLNDDIISSFTFMLSSH